MAKATTFGEAINPPKKDSAASAPKDPKPPTTKDTSWKDKLPMQ